MYKSTFMGLNTALRGVLAHQAALDVTGHNISNINTEGYSRQRAELVTTTPWANPSWNTSTAPGQMGTGVEVASLERLRDSYADVNARLQFGRQDSASTFVGQLEQVEAAFAEPSDRGIAARLQRFFGALEDVAAYPEDMAARQAFANAADALATGFNQLASDIAQIQAQSDTRLDDNVTTINSITQRIASLNRDIGDAINMGQQPNDLLDERDRLMDDLSKVVNYTYTQNASGQVTISFGAGPINIVDPLAPGGMTAIVRADLDAAYAGGQLTAGSAFADQEFLNTTAPALLAELDSLVDSVVTGINAQNAAGFDLNGLAGGNIFDPAGTTAATMALDGGNDILANPRLIAAASSWNAPGEPGNGDNAAAMIQLRAAVQGPPLNASWEGFYGSTVSNLGSLSATARRDLENQALLVEMANDRRAQVSGVSLDEEMSNMLRFQHAYNASARVMTTMDDALDTIINRMGRVGL